MSPQVFHTEMIEVIVGMVAIIGALTIIFNKFGLIHFGKRTKEEYFVVKQCTAHSELVKANKENFKELGSKIQELHDNQIKNIELHKQHQSRFNGGDKAIAQLKRDIKNLCIGVAVLLERSGGKPKAFHGDDDDV